MNYIFLLAALAGVTFALPASAADLGKVERTLAKEPSYKSKPKYCLLVFGPEAKFRAWLVFDGDVLYVDRNGNGDLTEDGERTDTKERLGLSAGFGVEFKGGVITDLSGKVKHTDLIIRRLGFGPSTNYTVNITLEGTRRQYAAIDEEGVLRFADRPQHAPLIHFGGPLEMKLLLFPKETLVPNQMLHRGEKGSDLTALIGTPGVGKGTLAMLLYDGSVAEDIHPLAEIEWPSQDTGVPPARSRIALTSRC
jgi:hypothetical protein